MASIPSDSQRTPAAMSAAFESFFEEQNEVQLRYFKPREFLVKGASHFNSRSSAYGLNTDPPPDVWKHILPTARVLEELRARLGAPIRLLSVYRSPKYNHAIEGALHSQHVDFRAIDFVCDRSRPDKWAQELIQMRHEGSFSGGIGRYRSFVHVDTRGWNADW